MPCAITSPASFAWLPKCATCGYKACSRWTSPEALQALGETLPIRIEHYGPWLTLIGPALRVENIFENHSQRCPVFNSRCT
jgi:hypothetical protein